MESSDRRRMKPICGPLPCVTTTFQPLSIMSAMWCAVSAAACVLVGDGLVVLVADQRVAANRHDRKSLGRRHRDPPNASSGYDSGTVSAKRRDRLREAARAARG